MRSSLKLRWHGVVWVAVLAAGGVLSGCAVDTRPDISASRPTSTISQPCRAVSAGEYCVQPGDTLDSVARGFGRKPQDVAYWNGVSPGAPLRVGQLLRLTPPDAPSRHASPVHQARTDAAPAASAVPATAPVQFAWPVNGMIVREFGEGGSRGIEIAGRAGTPVKAAAAGRVVYAGNGIKTYGLMVIIKHEDGFVTAYGNNRRLLVREGDAVQRGAAIAEMGTQGDGEALLQFEMREGSHAVDPLAHLPADSGPVVE